MGGFGALNWGPKSPDSRHIGAENRFKAIFGIALSAVKRTAQSRVAGDGLVGELVDHPTDEDLSVGTPWMPL
jgi:hypothetical protein